MSKTEKKKTRQISVTANDDSDDDFVSPKSNTSVRKEKQRREEKQKRVKAETAEKTYEETSEADGTVRSCPLCGKKVEQSSHSGHLKQCGARLGLSTEQLVEARRLEERHREDRLRLGLPDWPAASAVRRQTGRKKAARCEGEDPDLELALALSVSSCLSSVTTEDSERPGTMWLPQPPAKKRGKQKRDVGKALQARTEKERQRLVGERVMAVLEETSVLSTRPRPGSSGAGLWSLAARLDTVRAGELLVDSLTDVMAADNKLHVEVTADETGKAEVDSAGRDSSELVATQWLQLLESGEESDVEVSCQDVSLACHSLVLRVRCPRLVPRLITETSRTGASRHLLLCDLHRGATVLQALRWVYGGVRPRDKKVLRLLVDWGVTDCAVSEENEPEPDSEAAPPAGSQCLEGLINCMESEEESSVSAEEKSNTEEDSIESDWQEMCQIMTQRKRSEMSASQSGLFCEGEQREDSGRAITRLDIEEKHSEPSSTTRLTATTSVSRSSSPDMFASSDNEYEDEQGELEVLVKADGSNLAGGGVKRKTESDGEDQNSSKRLCSSYHEEPEEEEDEPMYDLSGEVIDLTQPSPSPPPPTKTETTDEDVLVRKLSDLTGQLVEPELPDQEIISLLVQLAVLEVTVPALLQSGAGKVVRQLKNREGKAGRLAGRLVIRWKKVVLNYRPADQDQERKTESAVEQVEKKAETSQELLNQTGLGIAEQDQYDHDDPDEDQDLPDIPSKPDISDDELPSLEASYYDLDYNYENIPPANPTRTPEHRKLTEVAPASLLTPVMQVTPASLRTPVSKFREKEEEAVTPLPDYSLMLTPELRAELKKFGLKVSRNIPSVIVLL